MSDKISNLIPPHLKPQLIDELIEEMTPEQRQQFIQKMGPSPDQLSAEAAKKSAEQRNDPTKGSVPGKQI
jgi:hypothetical protein